MSVMIPEWVLDSRKQWAKNDAERDALCKVPEGISIERDIPYREGSRDKWDLLDLYKPEGAADPLPVIVSAHGGGFFYGDKELYSFYCMDLASRGFAVINYNYHLSPESHFPAPQQDLNAVFVWLCENAEKYGLDKDNVILIGDSAGAQIANQYAAIWSNPAYAALFDFAVPEVTLRGAGLACGIYNLKENLKRADDATTNYLGEGFDAEDPRIDIFAAITENFPATFIFSTCHDFLLPEFAPMADCIKSKGVSVFRKVYGAEDRPDIAHVFHLDFRLSEAEEQKAEFIAWAKKQLK